MARGSYSNDAQPNGGRRGRHVQPTSPNDEALPRHGAAPQRPAQPQRRPGDPAPSAGARGQAPHPAPGAPRPTQGVPVQRASRNPGAAQGGMRPPQAAPYPQQRTQGMPVGRNGRVPQGPSSPRQDPAAPYRRPNPYAQQPQQQYGAIRHPNATNPYQAKYAGYGSPYVPARGYGGVPGGASGVNIPYKKKMKIWKKAAVIALAVVLCFGLAGFGLTSLFMSSLDSNMRGDDQMMTEIEKILDNTSYDQGVYTLVLASDSRSGTVFSNAEGYEDGTGRSDVIMLVRSDPATHAITLVSVPRDTPYTINGQKTKINEAFRLGGAIGEIEAVEQITGVSISHYVQVDFAGLEKFIDALGGIVVDVPIDMQGTDPLTGDAIYLYAGEDQRLNGAEALTLARTRKEYGADQEAKRQFGIREMATAIIKEVTSKPPLELPGLISELSTCITSDVSTSDMAMLASKFAGGGTKIYSATGPSKGADDPETGMWLCYENPEGWKSLMATVEAGEDPSGVDVESTAIIPE